MLNKKKLIALLGGSFDPIHNGHIHVAHVILDLLPFNEIRLIPCKKNPLKETAPVASDDQRLEMIKIAIQNESNILLDDRELRREGDSYTIDTVTELKNEYPEAIICCVMSTDVFCQFDRWKDWNTILNKVHIIITNRPGMPLKVDNTLTQLVKDRKTTDVTQLQMNDAGLVYMPHIAHFQAISASNIRELIPKEHTPDHLLPQGVWEYIQKHNIYYAKS